HPLWSRQPSSFRNPRFRQAWAYATGQRTGCLAVMGGHPPIRAEWLGGGDRIGRERCVCFPVLRGGAEAAVLLGTKLFEIAGEVAGEVGFVADDGVQGRLFGEETG